LLLFARVLHNAQTKTSKTNLVASVYSQNDNKICTKIEQSIATNNVWYYDSRKIKNWLSVVGGLQLSSSLKANSLFNEKDAELDAKINK